MRKVYLSISGRALKPFHNYWSSNVVFLFNLSSSFYYKPRFFFVEILQWLYWLPRALFDFVLWGKSAIWNGNSAQPVSVCTPIFLLHPPALLYYCCLCLLLTMGIFRSAAMLHGLLETAWKLFKLFLFHFSLCPILSSSLFWYDLMRCYFDSSASLFSSLLHALQINLSLCCMCAQHMLLMAA